MYLLNYIVDVATRLGSWGYLVIFLVIVLECQALLGFFIPAESLVLISGFLSTQGVLDLDAVIITISAAAIVGDNIGYELGKHLGRDWLLQYGRRFGINQKTLQRTDDFFGRHGGKGVFFSHFMHLLRAVVPFLSGAGRMPHRRFFIFNAAGCIVWGALFSVLGFVFGNSWRYLDRWAGRAGALLGALLIICFALLWAWQWMVRHENELRQKWQTHPRIEAVRRRFAPQIRFLKDRLTPGGFLGLYLTIGVLVITASSWCFWAIVHGVLTQDQLVALDDRVGGRLREGVTPSVAAAADVVSFLGSPFFLAGASVAIALVLASRRLWYRLLALFLTMAGGVLLDVLLEAIFSRKPFAQHDRLAAFPSGHVMGATLFYLFLGVNFSITAKQWRWRVLWILSALGVIFLVSTAGLCLGSGSLSDGLGAVAAGVAWLACCMTSVETLRRSRQSE